jgi:hypothetical protein
LRLFYTEKEPPGRAALHLTINLFINRHNKLSCKSNKKFKPT